MNLLLDTCTFLWISQQPAKLSANALNLFTDPANTCYLSAISVWEIAILLGLNRLTLAVPLHQFVPQQRLAHCILTLPLGEAAATLEPALPRLHKDPFDRMLICQAQHDNMTILTPDLLIRQYPVLTAW